MSRVQGAVALGRRQLLLYGSGLHGVDALVAIEARLPCQRVLGLGLGLGRLGAGVPHGLEFRSELARLLLAVVNRLFQLVDVVDCCLR